MKKFYSIALSALILSGFSTSAVFAKNIEIELEILDKTPTVNYGYANFAVRRAKIESEIDSCLLMLEQHPKDLATLNKLGCLYCELGLLNNATESFDEALSSYQNAIIAFDKALKLEPNNKEIRKNRSIALEKLEETEKVKRENKGKNKGKNKSPSYGGLG